MSQYDEWHNQLKDQYKKYGFDWFSATYGKADALAMEKELEEVEEDEVKK